MADCMQFLSENRLNGCLSNFAMVRFVKTKSKQNFGFLHIPSNDSHSQSPSQLTKLKQIVIDVCSAAYVTGLLYATIHTLYISKYDKVMFAHSCSEDSHEHASVNNML